MNFLNTIFLLLISITVYAHDSDHLDQLPQLDFHTEQALSRNNASVSIDPRGQLTLDTNGGYRSVTLTRIGKDGKNETFCTSNSLDAQRFLKGEDLKSIEGEQK